MESGAAVLVEQPGTEHTSEQIYMLVRGSLEIILRERDGTTLSVEAEPIRLGEVFGAFSSVSRWRTAAVVTRE